MEREDRSRTRWARTAVVLAIVTWSASVFGGGFSHDDEEAILQGPVVRGELPLAEAFRRDYWGHIGEAGHYRPLATASLRLDYAIWGESPHGYHLTNVALHAAVVAVLALVLLSLKGAGTFAFLGLAVFAVHPALADSVAWISGRTSSLSALGGGLALLAVARVRRTPLAQVGATLGLLLGLLAKEDAVLFALPLLLLAAARSRGRLAACGLSVIAAVSAYLLMRAGALGSAIPSAPYAPLADAPLLDRLLFGGRALLEGARLTLFPFAYPPAYGAAPGFTPRVPPGVWAALGWLPWLALLAGGAWSYLRGVRRGNARARLVGASAALAALSVLPVLQIVPAGEVFAPRFLYLPLLFVAPALGTALRRLPTVALVIVLAVLVVTAWRRSSVYADRESYAMATLAHVPTDVAAHNELGLALDAKGHREQARVAWREAVRLDPGYSRAWVNLGLGALADGDLDSAEAALRRGVRVGPRNAVARLNLASVLTRQERYEEAESLCREAVALEPGRAAAWRGLGYARLKLGEWDGAVKALRRAIRLAPADERARSLLRKTLLERRAADGRPR